MFTRWGGGLFPRDFIGRGVKLTTHLHLVQKLKNRGAISPLPTVCMAWCLIPSLKVKLPLCLTKHNVMEVYRGVEVLLNAFLTSALDGGEWSASLPGRFISRGRSTGTHWIGGWVGPRAGLDVMLEETFPAPAVTRTPDHPARSPVLCHWAIPAPNFLIKQGISLNYVVLS
jgi:hypothetical protein